MSGFMWLNVEPLLTRIRSATGRWICRMMFLILLGLPVDCSATSADVYGEQQPLSQGVTEQISSGGKTKSKGTINSLLREFGCSTLWSEKKRENVSSAIVTGLKSKDSETANQSFPVVSVIKAWLDESKKIIVVGMNGKGWVDVRENPRQDAVRIAQLLLGEQVRLITRDSKWIQIRFGHDGESSGWIPAEEVVEDINFINLLQRPSNLYMIIKSPGYLSADGLYIPCGVILPGYKKSKTLMLLKLPGNGRINIPIELIKPVTKPLNTSQALAIIKEFHQTPFQTGGNTASAMDAEGIVGLFCRLRGISVPRDSSLLLKAGESVDIQKMLAGDVVFFSTYDQKRLQPAILIDNGKTFILAAPWQGVGFGMVGELRNRKIVEVKRYAVSDSN
jgi:hypothetical protein